MHTRNTLPIEPDRHPVHTFFDELGRSVFGNGEPAAGCSNLSDALRYSVTLIADPFKLGLVWLAWVNTLSGHRVVPAARLAALDLRSGRPVDDHRPHPRAIGFCRSGRQHRVPSRTN